MVTCAPGGGGLGLPLSSLALGASCRVRKTYSNHKNHYNSKKSHFDTMNH